MKKANITVSYDEEKLNAVRLFLEQKNLKLENELTALIDTLFKKHVPASVRDYLELRDCVTLARPQKKTDEPPKTQV